MLRRAVLKICWLSLVASPMALGQQVTAGGADRFPSGLSTPFARVLHDDNDAPQALQIALTRYVGRSGGSNVSVDLVGAVHVGDRGYYQELNQRFQRYDAVLFELVAPEGAAKQLASTERRGLISSAQLAMTKALGLSFQLDEIDYTAENFVHADLSPTELSQSMADRDESLYVYFWRMFYASVNDAAKDPLGLRELRSLHGSITGQQESPLKVMFAYEMTNVDAISGALSGEQGSAIIEARNEKAIDVLRQALDEGQRNVAIFYGVAHMPDFEERLMSELDLRYAETIWINAWRLQSPKR